MCRVAFASRSTSVEDYDLLDAELSVERGRRDLSDGQKRRAQTLCVRVDVSHPSGLARLPCEVAGVQGARGARTLPSASLRSKGGQATHADCPLVLSLPPKPCTNASDGALAEKAGRAVQGRHESFYAISARTSERLQCDMILEHGSRSRSDELVACQRAQGMREQPGGGRRPTGRLRDRPVLGPNCRRALGRGS